ncbi:MAG TPA: Verru_Chthon cassette protein A, partial [Roseimicrobium sp.]|nr:Verru_Chthon cassette protein A [Roseimicrobium sp.]
VKNDFVPNYPAGAQEYYPFQSSLGAVKFSTSQTTFDFTGANVIVRLYYGGSNSNSNSPALQTINLSFPSATGWPIPKGAPNTLQPVKTPALTVAPTRDVTTWASTNDAANYGSPPIAGNQANGSIIGLRHYYWTNHGCFLSDAAVLRNGVTTTPTAYAYTTSLQASWSLATRIAWVTHVAGDSSNPHTNSASQPISPGYWGDRWRCIFQPGDTVRSVVYWDAKHAVSQAALSGAGPIRGGDLRIGALSTVVQPTDFAPHPDYAKPYSRACILRGGDGAAEFPVGNLAAQTPGSGGSPAPILALSPDPTREAVLGNHIFLGNSGTLKMQPSRAFGNLPWGGGTNISNTAGVNGVNRPDGGGANAGDFDTGLGDFPDGPFCNKQDEGNVIYKYLDTNTQQWVYPIPYFTATWSYQAPGNTFTSPSRQMPSAGMFGSLPSFPVSQKGWTTLAFAPNQAGPNHPGNVDPKDHYLLDLFQMPVVEPYPISEPFSTAGKVNLNYRIAPFDYIRRSTALRGALYPLRVTAVNSQYSQPSASANYLVYKTGFPAGTPLSQNFRLRIDRDETIKALDGFYDSGSGNPSTGFFKSASQICERYFYSQDSVPMNYAGSPTAEDTSMALWWKSNGDLTGDNEREKPYVDLYPRVTTKSNTYTVHVKVQTLRQTPGHPTQWLEGKDAVLGEYRGSATIERYIDPADPRFNPSNIPSYNPDLKSLEPLYRFRTVYTKKFTP